MSDFDKLWHYTTFDTFKKIWESQCLWATDYRYLNDRTELTLAEEYLMEKILFYMMEDGPYFKKIEENTRKKVILDSVQILYKVASNPESKQSVYITSFCIHKNKSSQNHGLLSQWRAYGCSPQEQGVCVVFNRQKLDELIKSENKNHPYVLSDLIPVIYSDNANEEMQEEIQGFLPSMNVFVSEYLFRRNDPSYYEKFDTKMNKFEKTNLFRQFIRLISMYKHEGFHEESEMRIVKVPIIQGFNKPKPIISAPKPHIELFKESGLLRSAIKEIIIGPSLNKEEQEKIKKELSELLKDTGIIIKCSETPFILQGKSEKLIRGYY